MSAQGSIRRTSFPGALDRQAAACALLGSILVMAVAAGAPHVSSALSARQPVASLSADSRPDHAGGTSNPASRLEEVVPPSQEDAAPGVGRSASAAPVLLTRSAEGNSPPYLDAIGAGVSWAQPGAPSRVTIAVVDSGVDVTHPDLLGHLWENPQWQAEPSGVQSYASSCVTARYGCAFVLPETASQSCGYRMGRPASEIADDNGHGTFVAGVALAAARSAPEGVDVRILPVKVLDCAGDGRASQAAAGVRYAAQSGARVIVLAFSGTSDVPALRAAVAEARQTYGAVVVAAAGNDSGVVAQFPSGYPGVLGVGGTGANDLEGRVDYQRLAPFSNLSEGVRVLAPAVEIQGPVPRALCGQRDWICTSAEPNAYASGTSYATPLVAGAFAVLLAYDPTLTADQATQLLIDTASPVHGSAAGQIDIEAALARARAWREAGDSAWSASGFGLE